MAETAKCKDCDADYDPDNWESHTGDACIARLRAELDEVRASNVRNLADKRIAEERAEEAETRCSSMVSQRDLTILDLRAQLSATRAVVEAARAWDREYTAPEQDRVSDLVSSATRLALHDALIALAALGDEGKA